MSFVSGGLVYPGQPSLPIGMIAPYAGASAPEGWLLCDGSAISRTTYAELFAIVGTTFGAGDGSTTFNLPSLANKSPMGAGSTVALGATGGSLTSAHAHEVGSFRVEPHSHDDGSLQVAPHTHGNGSLAAAPHTHGAGEYVTAQHAHPLDDGGWAQITMGTAGGGNDGNAYMRAVAATSWNSNRELDGAALAGLSGLTSGAALDGATALSTNVAVSGVSGVTTPDVTGDTGSAMPDVTGSTGLSAATVSGTSAAAAPSVLHPVLGVGFIIYAGA